MTLNADEPAAIQLRKPCTCGSTNGHIQHRSGQDVAYCNCGKYAGYCVPRSETGKERRSLRSRPEIPPSQHSRILSRDANRCIYCGRGPVDGIALVIGHLISVADDAALGLTEKQLFHDENLAAMCEEDNAGLGRNSVPARIIATLIRHRAALSGGGA